MKPQWESIAKEVSLQSLHIIAFYPKTQKFFRSHKLLHNCLVPVGHLPRPSRLMHFGDVLETNGRETRSDHVTQNAKAARSNET